MRRLLILEDLSACEELAGYRNLFIEDLRDLDIRVEEISSNSLSFDIHTEDDADFSSLIGWVVGFAYTLEFTQLSICIGSEEC